MSIVVIYLKMTFVCIEFSLFNVCQSELVSVAALRSSSTARISD